MDEIIEEKALAQEIKFSKEQILSSNKFNEIEKDVLKVLLEDKEYNLEEVKKSLEDFKKKEVKEDDRRNLD